jgi:hypothetical protein
MKLFNQSNKKINRKSVPNITNYPYNNKIIKINNKSNYQIQSTLYH